MVLYNGSSFLNIGVISAIFNSFGNLFYFIHSLMQFARSLQICLFASFTVLVGIARGVTFHSLLVEKSRVTRCKIRSLLVAKNHSLLVAKFTRYSLQKITRYSLQKLLVAKNHSLLVAKFARYSLQKLLVAKNHSLLVAKFARCRDGVTFCNFMKK